MSSELSVNIVKGSAAAWQDVCSVVNKSLVFMDGALAECLHWNGGAMLLINAGARNIKEFSSFESCDVSVKKAVFLISGELGATTRQIMRDVISASHLQFILVVTTVPPSGQSRRRGSVPDTHDSSVFDEMEDTLLEWMGDHNYTAEVKYLPLVIAPITPHLFMLPQHSSLFPLLPTDLHTAGQLYQQKKSSSSDLDMSQLPNRQQLQSLVCSLNSLLDVLSVGDDIYSVGHTSRMVATQLASFSWAKTRRKTASHKASLLLVDRSLDLTSAIGHHSDTLLDRLLCSLPRLAGHSVDVAVNMSRLASVRSGVNFTTIAPGCVAHPSDVNASALLNTLASTRHKDGVSEVNRQLSVAASKEGFPIESRSGKVTSDHILSNLNLFSRQNDAIRRHCGLLQLAMATQHALGHCETSDSLLAIEKGLLQTLSDDPAMTLATLTTAVNRDRERAQNERLYTISDILGLLLYLYSMAGDILHAGSQQEILLQTALVSSILEADTLPEIIEQFVKDAKNEKAVRACIEEVFYKLHGLSSARNDLKQFSCVHTGGGLTSQASLKPLLKQLAQQIADPNKPELTDVEYKSTGFRDLLKSGFGLFMNVSKPRPSDHPLLIMFVIGGVTAMEARQIRETFSASKNNIQVLIGSTAISKPEDLVYQALIQDNLNPSNE